MLKKFKFIYLYILFYHKNSLKKIISLNLIYYYIFKIFFFIQISQKEKAVLFERNKKKKKRFSQLYILCGLRKVKCNGNFLRA